MDKIKVEICLGTTCFVMGASKLQELEKFIPGYLKQKVEVTAKTCLDLCKNSEYASAPYVKVAGEVISEANIEKVISMIERKVNEQ